MAKLEYNGILLENVRTLDYSVEPDMDPSGMDFECVKVNVTVEGLWQDWALATNTPPYQLNAGGVPAPPDPKVWGQKGDRLGISIYTIREFLEAPRRRLRYWIGNDLVLISPQLRGDGSYYLTDVKGGPFPHRTNMVKIVGDRTAWVRFGVETYVSKCPHYLLSNRWSVHSSVDQHGFTSLTYHGRASFRKDFMIDRNLQPDDWRQYIILPCDAMMKRVGVDVTVNREGTEVEYVVHDRHTNYGTGANSAISKIECNVTSGARGAIQDIRGLATSAMNLGSAAAGTAGSIIKGDIGGAIKGTLGMGGQILNIMVPYTVLAGVCRVYGQMGADRFQLAVIGWNFLQDRLGSAFPVSATLHVDWSDETPPFIEWTVQHFGRMQMFAGQITRGLVQGQTKADPPLKWNSPGLTGAAPGTVGPDITGGSPLVEKFWRLPTEPGKTTPRTKLPKANNSRGAYVGQLVAQALSVSTCEVPRLPPTGQTPDRNYPSVSANGYNSDYDVVLSAQGDTNNLGYGDPSGGYELNAGTPPGGDSGGDGGGGDYSLGTK
jgi:hypothetical protein